MREDHARPVDDERLPIRHRLHIEREAQRRLSRTPTGVALFERAGGEGLGESVRLEPSVFGWRPDTVRTSVRGGVHDALHCFGALSGDGVDAWTFVVLDDEVVGFYIGLDYGQDEVRLRGTDPRGPLLDAVLAALREVVAPSP